MDCLCEYVHAYLHLGNRMERMSVKSAPSSIHFLLVLCSSAPSMFFFFDFFCLERKSV